MHLMKKPTLGTWASTLILHAATGSSVLGAALEAPSVRVTRLWRSSNRSSSLPSRNPGRRRERSGRAVGTWPGHIDVCERSSHVAQPAARGFGQPTSQPSHAR